MLEDRSLKSASCWGCLTINKSPLNRLPETFNNEKHKITENENNFRLQPFFIVFSEIKKTTGLPETGFVRVITTVS